MTCVALEGHVTDHRTLDHVGSSRRAPLRMAAAWFRVEPFRRDAAMTSWPGPFGPGFVGAVDDKSRRYFTVCQRSMKA